MAEFEGDSGMKMIKVESCGECPYQDYQYYDDRSGECESFPVCMNGDESPFCLINLKTIHPDCPLDDYKDWKGVVERVKQELEWQLTDLGEYNDKPTIPQVISKAERLLRIIQEEIERENND